jgi:hypothetical protein
VKDINACDRDRELSSFNINLESYSRTKVDLVQTEGFFMCPSPNYQPGDEGLLDECGTIVRSVDQVTLLLPDAVLDSAAAATPALPIVETVSDDDSVLAGDATCTTPADTASVTTHRPFAWDVRVAKSDVPNTPSGSDFDKCFASSGFSSATSG